MGKKRFVKPIWDDEIALQDGRVALATANEPDVEGRGFWSGPLGIAVRLGCVASAVVGVSLAVLASTNREGEGKVAPASASAGLAASVSASAAGPQRSAVFLPLSAPEPHGPTLSPTSSVRRPTVSPAVLCEALKVGDTSSGWSPSQISDREWECLSTLSASKADGAIVATDAVKGAASKAKAPGYRIFTMARGVGEDDVRFARFKLTATDEAQAQAGSVRLGERVDALFSALGWPVPERVRLGARLRQPFTLDDSGTRIRFIEERLSEFSYNLILEFPKPLAPAVAKAGPDDAGPAADDKKGAKDPSKT